MAEIILAGSGARSTKAGDYPRLRRQCSNEVVEHGNEYAQRRPEITPGYDELIRAGHRRDPACAQRRPEITPGYDPDAPESPFYRVESAQRRPEITPGYDHLGSLRPTEIEFAQRRPEITPGYDFRLPHRHGGTGGAQRRPEITPGYDNRSRLRGRGTDQRSTKAGDYPRLRPAGWASRR